MDFSGAAAPRQLDADAGDELYQPQEEQDHKDRNQAGGHQHDGQRFDQIVQHLLETAHGFCGGFADAVSDFGEQTGQPGCLLLTAGSAFCGGCCTAAMP